MSFSFCAPQDCTSSKVTEIEEHLSSGSPVPGHVWDHFRAMSNKRHVWAGTCSAEEGEETRWRERRQGGGREVEVGEWPRVVVDGLGRSGVGIVGEKGVCSLM